MNKLGTKNPIKAVIFDFDDTLVESRLAKWAQHKHVAKEFYNIELTDEDIKKHWGKPFHKLVGELYRNSDTPKKMMEAVMSVREKEEFKKKVHKGSPELMNELLDRGLKLGILTATMKKYLLVNLSEHNFPIDRLTIIQAADDTEVHKPDPAVFEPLLKKFKEEGIESSEIVYVGDSIDDLYSSKGAGVNFIAVTTGMYSEEDFKKEGVEIIVKRVTEITKYI
jgi:phosphoglycolate phosphatase-like HAD superfamily hydrolase